MKQLAKLRIMKRIADLEGRLEALEDRAEKERAELTATQKHAFGLQPCYYCASAVAITAKNIKVIRKPSRLYVFCSTCSTGRRSSIEALEKEVAS